MNDSSNGITPSASGSPEPPVRAHVDFEPQGQDLSPVETSGAVAQPIEQSEQAAKAEPSSVQVQPAAQAQPVTQAQREFTPQSDWGRAVAQADTSGIDAVGELPHTSMYEPLPSASRTESFAAGRLGDTSTLSSVTSSFESGYAFDSAGAKDAKPAASQAAASGPAAASTVPPLSGAQSRYSSSSQTYTANRGAAAPAAPAAASAGGRQSAAAKSSGGAGKTFLFGFLGALLACALAFGGFAFAGGFKSAGQTTAAYIGTTDQSVINAVDEGQALAEAVAAKALPSVVAIYNYQEQSASYGYGFGYGYGVGNQGENSMVATGMRSGVVISEDGYIITNYHVVEDAAKLTVSVNGVERDATYVGGDSSSDVAVIKVEDTEGLVAADIGDSDNLRIGQWVMTVGAPLGLESSVATGVVSATNRSTIMDSSSSSGDMYSYFYGNKTPEYTYYPNMIQTDAVINPGNSGGALVDADGKLIGINAMISSYSGDYAGVGFAIPVNYAIQIAQNVIEGKEPTHAIIGVSLSLVNSAIAQQYNLSTDKGAYISAITPDTGAADSDLQVGDIITKVDGKAVTSVTDVTLEVRAHKVGDTIPITVNRDGEELSIDVTLSSDENMTPTANQEEEQEQQQQDQRGEGFGGRGDGQGNGLNSEQLEELLRMLGM